MQFSFHPKSTSLATCKTIDSKRNNIEREQATQLTSCPVATSIAVCTVPDALYVDKERGEGGRALYYADLHKECIVERIQIKIEYGINIIMHMY